MKTVGGFRRTRYKGLDRTGLAGYLVATAYNLVRMAKLLELAKDHFGPNPIGHAIVAEAQELVVAEQAAMYCDSNVHGSQTNYYKVAPGISVMPLPGYAEMLVDDIVRQYGGLSIEDITEVTKQTKPFKTAAKYSVLVMEHSAPTNGSPDREWEKHRDEVENDGLWGLEDLKKEYGL